ncbi:hypothetical protein STENM223S_01600 [Streptomyces tendae]
MAARAPYRSLHGISAVAALLALGAVGCSDVTDAVDTAKDGAKKVARQRSVFSLDTGDCYNPFGKAEGTAYTVEIVPCEEAHEGQVVGEFSMDEGKEYPGDDRVSAVADTRCPVEAQKYAADTWALPKGAELFYYTPTAESWATGDRSVSCTYTAEKGVLSGTLDTAKSLKPEQLTYLKGSNAVYEALWANQPEKDTVEADLPGYKAQAKAVAAALREPRRGPEGHRRRRGRHAPCDADEGGRRLGEGRGRRRCRHVLHRLRPGVHRHRPEQVGRRPQGAGPGHDRPGRRGRGLGGLTHLGGAGAGRPCPSPPYGDGSRAEEHREPRYELKRLIGLRALAEAEAGLIAQYHPSNSAPTARLTQADGRVGPAPPRTSPRCPRDAPHLADGRRQSCAQALPVRPEPVRNRLDGTGLGLLKWETAAVGVGRMR